MDVRYTPEQVELRRTARRLARELAPRSVPDLDDDKRRARLAEAVRDAGWLELRQDDLALKIYLYSRVQSVMGGTSQIQKNIIATRILGLPTAG